MSGCALNAHGELKDPSEIQWFNDVDDDTPLPSTQATSSSSKPGTLDFFVDRKGSQARVAPATVIAGSRRSGRALKPSAKVRDTADTTTGPVKPSVPAKRSSDVTMPPARKHG